MINEIILGDCLDVMKDIPDGSIDMILCDLPYGTSACKWDVVISFESLWEEYERVIVDSGAIVLFGCEPFSSLLRVSNLKRYKYDWKWEKTHGKNFLNMRYQPAKVHEDIMVFGKMATSYSKNGNMKYNPQMESGKSYKTRYNGKVENTSSTIRSKFKRIDKENTGERFPRSIQKFKNDSKGFHPTQKPVALFEYLIKTYTNEGDVVLDNCIGSGTTAIACVNTNRNFIGIEKNEEYYNKAMERLNGVMVA